MCRASQGRHRPTETSHPTPIPTLPLHQVAADQLPKLAALRDRLTERLSGVRGAAVEDNVFSVSVHYRNCDPGDVQAVR